MKSFISQCLLLAALPYGINARDYYFDGSASTSGNGQQSSPFNTLSAIDNLSLNPGDSVLLKRGTRFSETLTIKRSGSQGSPITIGSYGDTSLPLPIVSAKPSDLNSVLLVGPSFITLQDLEITNPGNNKTARRGVYLYAQDAGEVRGVTIRRLYIHDVTGYKPSTSGGNKAVGKYANASGGLVVEAAGNNTPTYFRDLLIEDNVIRDVGRQGIYTWSNWCRRDALAAFWRSLCSQNWKASTGLIIRNNRLFNIGGDGIVVHGHENAVVHHNRVHVFNLNNGGVSAGIWTANADGTLFQYNVVSGGKTTNDGMSYDVDHSSSGTVYEYNVSHDNEGGFFLLCPYDTPTKNFTIRYNLSVNDRARVIEICGGDLVGGKFYKNTVAIGEGITSAIVTGPNNRKLDVLFSDNIIRKVGSGKGTWNLNSSAFKVDNNIFYGSIDTYAGATNTNTKGPNLAAPGLRDPNAYVLLAGSPALNSAVAVNGDAAQDFFGNPTISNKNQGFYSGGTTQEPQWISTFDQGTTSGWTAASGVSVVADPAGDLGQSAKLAAGGKLVRAYQPSSSGVRFDVGLLFTSTGGSAATVQVGKYVVSLDAVAAADVGYWRILEVTIGSDGNARALLDGNAVQAKAQSSGSANTVSVSAGGSALYVDDAFVVSL
ncbi:hypothetical protein QQS21_010945 [Conoideocrella luteorostrata]|uniref:Right handed beta helix domain-containing protein n=1 Tax=Conoideocrella luteorostrata TaxID=1105319 RepID=A0AAJ0CE21_9HYPO|nr:hypothetical protein QQS21_010945 [Conoideocrella luteorostrata]